MPDSPRARAGLMLALAGIAAWVLRTFPPWRYPVYPACPIRALTGWRCPGCGTTHALAAMLAGRWTDAWHYNAMAVVAYPVLAALVLVRIYSALRWNRWWGPAWQVAKTGDRQPSPPRQAPVIQRVPWRKRCLSPVFATPVFATCYRELRLWMSR